MRRLNGGFDRDVSFSLNFPYKELVFMGTSHVVLKILSAKFPEKLAAIIRCPLCTMSPIACPASWTVILRLKTG